MRSFFLSIVERSRFEKRTRTFEAQEERTRLFDNKYYSKRFKDVLNDIWSYDGCKIVTAGQTYFPVVKIFQKEKLIFYAYVLSFDNLLFQTFFTATFPTANTLVFQNSNDSLRYINKFLLPFYLTYRIWLFFVKWGSKQVVCSPIDMLTIILT